jgi:transposase
MMGRQDEPEQLIYEFRLDLHVTSDHPLRGIDALLDLGSIRKELAPLYSSTGRLSIDPELMIRMLLIGYSFAKLVERRRVRGQSAPLASLRSNWLRGKPQRSCDPCQSLGR